MNKKITIFLIVLLSFSIFVSLVPTSKAAIYTLVYNVSTTTGTQLSVPHPSSNGSASAVAETFNCTYSSYLVDVDFYLDGGLTGDIFYLRAGLWNITETYGTNSTPTGTALEYADKTYPSNGAVTNEWVSVTFSGTTFMAANTKYAITLEYVSYTNSTNTLYSLYVAAGAVGSYGGDPSKYVSGGWTLLPTLYDMNLRIYSSDVILVTYDPDATLPTSGGYNYTDWDTTIEAFTGFMVPLVLVLLPAALLCLLTRRVDKWLLIIGLAIGSALLYLFLGSQYLWLVFLVVIGLVGMAYQSVRGGG